MPAPPFISEMQDRITRASYADALLVDAAGIVTWARGRTVCAARREGLDVVGMPVLRLVAGEDRERAGALIAAARTTGALLIDTLRTGDARALEVALHDLGACGLLVETWDVTARDARERDLREGSLHDPMTGVATRLLVLDRLAHALLPRRTGTARVGALLVDLGTSPPDGASIDQVVLAEVARRILSVLRPGDTVGRLGGEEFMVVCTGIESLEALRRVAERILEVLGTPVLVHAIPVRPCVTIGGAACLDGSTLPAMLLGAARAARDEARAQGGGVAVLHAMDALPR